MCVRVHVYASNPVYFSVFVQYVMQVCVRVFCEGLLEHHRYTGCIDHTGGFDVFANTKLLCL